LEYYLEPKKSHGAFNTVLTVSLNLSLNLDKVHILTDFSHEHLFKAIKNLLPFQIPNQQTLEKSNLWRTLYITPIEYCINIVDELPKTYFKKVKLLTKSAFCKEFLDVP